MNVKIAAAQYPITQHSSLENWKKHIEKWITEAVNERVNFVVFPEYGSMELVSLLDFSLQTDIRAQVVALQNFLDEFCATFEALARQHQLYLIAPSFPVQLATTIVNRVFVFSPTGCIGHQDKLFMTRFETEEWKIDAGEPILTVFESPYGKFGVQICYDIEFAIGGHQLAQQGAEIIFVPSCTETLRGATRVHIGARARAMENQLYTVVAQTVGDAAWSPTVDVNYGYAAIYATPDIGFDPEGIEKIATAQKITWLIHEVDTTLLTNVRKEGQVLNYKDHNFVDYQFKQVVNSHSKTAQLTTDKQCINN